MISSLYWRMLQMKTIQIKQHIWPQIQSMMRILKKFVHVIHQFVNLRQIISTNEQVCNAMKTFKTKSVLPSTKTTLLMLR